MKKNVLPVSVLHNLDLPHCPDYQCFMRDAKEIILTINAAPEDLCKACKKK